MIEGTVQDLPYDLGYTYGLLKEPLPDVGRLYRRDVDHTLFLRGYEEGLDIRAKFDNDDLEFLEDAV